MLRPTVTLVVSLVVCSTTMLAQARLVDPPRVPPTRSPCAAVDAETGALYVMGGRDDRVLDVWRLHNGTWQRVATGPFHGLVTSLAYDTVRDRLVALVTSDSGTTSLQELDGTTWSTAPATPMRDSKLLWHPVRAQVLVWMPPSWMTTSYTLWTWDGVALAPVSMAGLTPFFGVPGDRIGYDSARDRLVVPQAHYNVSVPWVHEWDGTTWTTVVSAGGSSGGSTVLTDPFSGRVVFSANGSGGDSAWTGQAFVPWSAAGAPPHIRAVLVGNAVRQVCQLVGGTWWQPHGDAWEFDGTAWRQVSPDTADPQMVSPTMVAIGTRRALVFDAGYMSPGSTASTLLWKEGEWTVLQPAQTPPPRTRHALAGDPATGRAFLFGGTANGALLADFWMWTGSDWKKLPGGPGGRVDHGMCFRPDTQTVVLYGGNNGAGAANYETWEWNGTAWSLRNATFPPHTGQARLVWFPQRQRTVLATFGVLGVEMWEWDGVSWYSTSPPSRPNAAAGLVATYDPVRESILVVEAGSLATTPPQSGVIHEWDGTAWRSLAPEVRLRASSIAAAGVPGVGLVVANVTTRMTPTLEHDFPATVGDLGAACPDRLRVLGATQPWLGRSYTLRYPCDPGTACLFATGFSSAQWNGVPLPLDLSGLGLPGCSLRVAADVSHLRVPAAGSASVAIALPATPALAGIRLFHQACALAPGLTAVSQGVEIVTGSLW